MAGWVGASGRAEPADTLERRPGEAWQDAVDPREGLAGLLQIAFLLAAPFLAALDFGGVCHALLLAPVLREQQEVVDAGDKMRWRLLGRGRGRPGFFLQNLWKVCRKSRPRRTLESPRSTPWVNQSPSDSAGQFRRVVAWGYTVCRGSRHWLRTAAVPDNGERKMALKRIFGPRPPEQADAQ